MTLEPSPDRREQARRFKHLHDGPGIFVMPNAWDAGSARLLTQLGFPALGTTSAGLAFSRARPDAEGQLSRAEVLDNLRAIVAATDLPVSADLEAGYGEDAEEIAATFAAVVAAGAAGGSIEDATADPRHPLRDSDVAVERVRAAREAIDATGATFTLTARAECFLVGHPDPLAESIRRLRRYREAGADCLYAPGVREKAQIRTLVQEVGGSLNVLVGAPGLSVAELAELGVRRISVGSALTRVALGAMLQAAREIAASGTFDGLAGAMPHAMLNDAFRRPAERNPA
jgi:2-methylisocitrate lyase-like PEP mutase family enzyme